MKAPAWYYDNLKLLKFTVIFLCVGISLNMTAIVYRLLHYKGVIP